MKNEGMPLFFAIFATLAEKVLISALFAKSDHPIQNRSTNRTKPLQPA